MNACTESKNANAVLSISDLHVKFKGRGGDAKDLHVLRGIELELNQNEIVSLVGESGSGKSTLARTIMGLQKPTYGSVQFRGTDILGQQRTREMRGKIQFVPQDPKSSLNPRMRIWQCLVEPLLIRGGSSREDLHSQALKLATSVGIRTEQLQRFPHELSGGQRQRIALGRALSTRPELLILDEPTSALDISIQAAITNLLLNIQQEFRLSYLFISHDVSLVRHISDRVAVMYAGQIVETGGVSQVLDQASHPYTSLLVNSHPRFGERMLEQKFPVISTYAEQGEETKGCLFQQRCEYKITACEQEQSLKSVAGLSTKIVRCHRALAGDINQNV